MALTLREVLDLDVVRRGSPLVVAGAARLDVPVRWVHAAEHADIGRLLRGGELVVATGVALPGSAGGTRPSTPTSGGCCAAASWCCPPGSRYRNRRPG